MPTPTLLAPMTPPPTVPQPALRTGSLPDGVTDALFAIRSTLTFLRALLVWLQQQLTGLRRGLFDTVVPWADLQGTRDGVNTQFTITAGTVRLGLNSRPQALMFQGAVAILYTPNASPAAGQWTLTGQTFVLGTPPTGS